MLKIVEQSDIESNDTAAENVLENAYTVLEDFFTDFGLQETKEALWEMVEVCLTADNIAFQKAEDRENLLYRYKHLEKMLTASFCVASGKHSLFH
jgi:hypothetical protein